MEEDLITASEFRFHGTFDDRPAIYVGADVQLKELELIERSFAASDQWLGADAFGDGTLYICNFVQVIVWMDAFLDEVKGYVCLLKQIQSGFEVVWLG